jgi:hypothetical protein
MLVELIVVHGIDDHSTQPQRLARTPGHGLLRQFAQRVAVLLGGFRGNLQGALGVWVVGREQDPAVRFHRQNPVTGFEPKPIGHVFRQGRTH